MILRSSTRRAWSHRVARGNSHSVARTRAASRAQHEGPRRVRRSEADVGIRTRDLSLTMRVLYQLSYVGVLGEDTLVPRFRQSIRYTFCPRLSSSVRGERPQNLKHRSEKWRLS